MTDLRKLYGTDEPLRDRRGLSRDPAEVTLEDGRLRHLRLDGVEAIRGLAFLVRDRDWGTVVPQIRNPQVEDTGSAIRVTYDADYIMGGCLSAKVMLQLTADGLDATVVAQAQGDVWTNRAGFTVLHPIRDVAGAPVVVDHADGTQTRGAFPDLIAPWQPFQDIAALTHQAGPWRVACRFAGDVFEMEDQRQWGDASFKTYNRPLALPWPYRIADGERLEQSVSIRWHRQPAARAAAPPRVGVPAPTFPQTALLVTGADAVRATARPDQLRAIAPQRLLCHLDATVGRIREELRAFADLQRGFPDISFDVELIAACPPGAELRPEFLSYAEALEASGLRAASVMVTPAVDRQSTPPGSPWPDCPPLEAILDAARDAFPAVPLGGGVASFFPELNRKRPPVGMLDFITHGFCPIVHAADDVSVLETLETVPHVLASGRAIAGGAEYRLGPSMIAMRQNPYGSRTIPNPDRRRVCMADDDPRQDGDFAAAWSCGLAAALATAGLTVWTPASLYGPRGLVGDDGGMRPVAGVVAALAQQAGQPVQEARMGDGIARLRTGGATLLANLSAQPLRVEGKLLDPFGWWQAC